MEIARKKGRQAGGEGEVQGVGESGSKPRSVSLQSPGSSPEPRKSGKEKDERRPEIMVQMKRGYSLREGRPVPLSVGFYFWSLFLVTSARLYLFKGNSMQRPVP